MKISPSSIKKFLNEEEFTKFKAVLFYGNNIGLIYKYIDHIANKFFQNFIPAQAGIPAKLVPAEAGTRIHTIKETLNKVTIDYASVSREPDLLLNEIRTSTFFCDRKVIIINEVAGVISKQLEKLLLEESNSEVLIIFYGNQITTKDKVRKFFESQQELVTVPCYLENVLNVEKEVRIKLQEAGIQVEHPEMIKYIANNIGGDSAHISTEIDKLISSHKQEKKITFKKVKNIISKSSTDADCDKYIAYLMEEKFLSAESELKKLILAETKPHFIIRALSRYFIKLYLAHGLIADGISEIEVPSKLNPPIFFKTIPTFKIALKKYSLSKVMEILEHLLKLEINTKTHDTMFAKIILERELFNIFIVNNSVRRRLEIKKSIA